MSNPVPSKSELLFQLAERRRQKRLGSRFLNLADILDGVYDLPYVSPITHSANNVDSDILIMLRVWSWKGRPDLESIDEEVRERGFNPSLKSNEKLADRLQAHFGLHLKDVYVTNLFPFIPKNLRQLKSEDLRESAKEFGIPQIEIIRPRHVICLGVGIYNAINFASSNGAAKPLDLRDAMANPFGVFSSQVHCLESLGEMHEPILSPDEVNDSWERLAEQMKQSG